MAGIAHMENLTTPGALDLAPGEQFNIVTAENGNLGDCNVHSVISGPVPPSSQTGVYADAKPFHNGMAGPFTAGDGPGGNDAVWSDTGCSLAGFGLHNSNVTVMLNPQPPLRGAR